MNKPIRKMDDMGRVVVPKSLRRDLGLVEGTPIEFVLTKEGLLLKPYRPKEEEIDWNKLFDIAMILNAGEVNISLYDVNGYLRKTIFSTGLPKLEQVESDFISTIRKDDEPVGYLVVDDDEYDTSMIIKALEAMLKD